MVLMFPIALLAACGHHRELPSIGRIAIADSDAAVLLGPAYTACRQHLTEGTARVCTVRLAKCMHLTVTREGSYLRLDGCRPIDDVVLLPPKRPDGTLPAIPSGVPPDTCAWSIVPPAADCRWDGQGRDELGRCVGVPACHLGWKRVGDWCEDPDLPLSVAHSLLDDLVAGCVSAAPAAPRTFRIGARTGVGPATANTFVALSGEEGLHTCLVDALRSVALPPGVFVLPFESGGH